MGAAASVINTIDEQNGVSDDCTTFISYFLSYCPLNPKGKKLRNAAWRVIDNNGNGYVSLAETGKWIKVLLETQMVKEAGAADKGKGGKTTKANVRDAQGASKLLYKRFYPCYIRAFLDAADIGKNGKGGGAEITKDDDRRISLAELKGACKKFSGHPLVGAAQLGMPDSYGNVESVFMEMDADGKGMVLLNER